MASPDESKTQLPDAPARPEYTPVPAPVGVDRTLQELLPRLRDVLTAVRADGAEPDKVRVEFLETIKAIAASYPRVLEEDPAKAEAVVDDVLRHLLQRPEALDDAHAVLPYPDNVDFYRTMLTRGKNSDWLEEGTSMDAWEAFSKRCQLNLATLQRRDWDLDGAMREYLELLHYVQHHRMAALPGTGVLKYEIAYIHFLQGNLKDAAPLFQQSADESAAAGREVGAYISRSHQHLVEQRVGAMSLDELRAFFEQGKQTFQQKAATDPSAERWIMNSNHRLFEIAIQEGDCESAAQLLDALRNDPFLAKNPLRVGPDFFLRCEAKLAALRGDDAGALEYLKKLLPVIGSAEDPGALDGREGIAEDYLVAGSAFKRLGQSEQAKKILHYALSLPGDHGNSFWQQKIQAELA